MAVVSGGSGGGCGGDSSGNIRVGDGNIMVATAVVVAVGGGGEFAMVLAG